MRADGLGRARATRTTNSSPCRGAADVVNTRRLIAQTNDGRFGVNRFRPDEPSHPQREFALPVSRSRSTWADRGSIVKVSCLRSIAVAQYRWSIIFLSFDDPQARLNSLDRCYSRCHLREHRVVNFRQGNSISKEFEEKRNEVSSRGIG